MLENVRIQSDEQTMGYIFYLKFMSHWQNILYNANLTMLRLFTAEVLTS